MHSSRSSRLLRSLSLWVTQEKTLQVGHVASVELVNISVADRVSMGNSSLSRLEERDYEVSLLEVLRKYW